MRRNKTDLSFDPKTIQGQIVYLCANPLWMGRVVRCGECSRLLEFTPHGRILCPVNAHTGLIPVEEFGRRVIDVAVTNAVMSLTSEDCRLFIEHANRIIRLATHLTRIRQEWQRRDRVVKMGLSCRERIVSTPTLFDVGRS
jgi:hypothetical protein